MLDEGVERRSDGVHRFHWKRIDSDGKVHFSIRERLGKIPLMLDEGEGVPMPGEENFLFVTAGQKLSSC